MNNDSRLLIIIVVPVANIFKDRIQQSVNIIGTHFWLIYKIYKVFIKS
jgi:hypothetical protein